MKCVPVKRLMPATLAVPVLLLCLPMAAGCGDLREAAGLTKKSPDEFAVTTTAPLVIPPDFNLRPPAPGAPPTNQSDPSTSAQTALFNSQDPQTVASNMTGNYSMAEKLLLANAGVQNADPGVRTKLRTDLRAMQAADTSFTDRVLGASPTPFTGQPVNPDAELGKRASKRQQTPTPKNDSGGWFDWLF
jgi:hypothetical protein